MNTLVDTDVVYKAIIYNLIKELITERFEGQTSAILGAAPFLMRRKLARLPGDQAEAMIVRLEVLMATVEVLEPTEHEISLAASIEAAAQSANVALDAGESQLCAALLQRNLPRLITGDKRAIAAIEALLPICPELSGLCGRVYCFEQCVLDRLNQFGGYNLIRSSICNFPDLDKTLMICFSCLAQAQHEDHTRACLESYISDLRSKAPLVLGL